MVVKILYKREVEFGMEQLGMDKPVLHAYQGLLKKERGLVLVVAPPGSGKNTTLYSSLNYLNSPAKNVATCETIVKFELPGVVQSRYDDRAEISYEETLRAIIAQEPDLLLVGEVKTEETARILVQSAFAKRLVFGRLVANDTVNGIQILLDMGVKPFLVSASLHCVVAQRLLRKLCPTCRERYSPSVGLIKEMGVPLKEDVNFFRPKGCDECNQTGFQGYIAIFEVLDPTEEIKEAIVAREPAPQIRQKAIQKGMVTLKRDGLKKAFYGLTTIEEVLASL